MGILSTSRRFQALLPIELWWAMPILEQPPWQRRLFPFAGITHLELLDYKNQNNDERQKRFRCEEQSTNKGGKTRALFALKSQ